MMADEEASLGQLLHARRTQLGMSQYDLARTLAAISGRASIGRDRVARWERGRQVPRLEWRRWLAVALRLPQEKLDIAASTCGHHRRWHTPERYRHSHNSRPATGTHSASSLLPVFRSRAQATVLATAFLNPDREHSLAELARTSQRSVIPIAQETELLESAGLIASRTDGSERTIRAVTGSPVHGPLTDLLGASYGAPHVISAELASVPGVLRVVISGSWAARFWGLPGPQPDTVNLRIVTDGRSLPTDRLAAAVRRIATKTRCAVGYHLVTSSSPTTRDGLVRQGNDGPTVDIAPITPRSTGCDSHLSSAQLVHEMLQARQLERRGTAAVSDALFARSRDFLNAAERLAADAPAAGFLLLCHAAHAIGLALLARHQLQPTPHAHPMVVSRVILAGFGEDYAQLEHLRRRSLELMTPTSRDNRATAQDIRDYAPTVRHMLATARRTAGAYSCRSTRPRSTSPAL